MLGLQSQVTSELCYYHVGPGLKYRNDVCVHSVLFFSIFVGADNFNGPDTHVELFWKSFMDVP